MPRKKKFMTNKRTEVIDEDGWTRVTTTGKRHPAAVKSDALNVSTDLRTVPQPGSNVQKVLKSFEKSIATWSGSESCTVLDNILISKILQNDVRIDKCLIFGSGSFCGLSRGWISRHSVALQQLAIFCKVRDTIGESSHEAFILTDRLAVATSHKPRCLAQEPAYNDLDVDFLKTLDVEAVNSPAGYDLITEKSLVYAPYNEFSVEMDIISRKPAILITGKIDWLWRNDKGLACTNRQDGINTQSRDLEKDCRIIESFLQDREHVRLPLLDIKDNPFTNQYIYWLARKD